MKMIEPQVSSTNQDFQVRQKCELAKHLENAGDYEAARKALAGFWGEIGERPTAAGLGPATKAELLLRAGSLTGWLGSAQQVPQAQEIAKDLIAESARIFASLGQHEKVVEAQTDLAICYWRAGALEEAAVWFQEALSRASSVENRVRILINRAIVEIFSNRLDEALNHLSEAAPLLEEIDDHATHGRYHMQRAIAFKRLGRRDNLDRALIENAAASFHLEQARHARYLARVENNIAGILMELQRFDEALEHLNKARQIFTELKDDGSIAQVNETLAHVFLAQQRGAEAEQAAAKAVEILEHGDEQALLSEALTTRGIALSQMGRYQEALEIFSRGAQIAEVAGDRVSSGRTRLMMVEQLEHYLPPEDLFTLYHEADERVGEAPDSNTGDRLRSAARIAIAAALRVAGTTIEETLSNSSLKEEVRRYEGELIKRALERTDGQVTSAARMLGITHQGLCEMLKTRHQSLRIRPPRMRQRPLSDE
ncbi:MAG TPA: tetratricopeptide repeat protein [Pyrinomonadaceae bacterium]|jgi:tetratricopeptide (TPR) repeat protein|nr:tetratricopeptide repeat protein [Pyrinomonadaceae bacterium]